MLSLNCHAIAQVQEVDYGDLTVTCKMMYNQTFYEKKPDGTFSPTYVDYPLLVDCPFIVLGGGDTSLTFPIAEGDECLILFNDRDIDYWVAGKKSGSVATNRLHAFCDAIALVGFIKPGSYDPARALLRNGTTYVGVSADKVKIANAITTLNTLLQDLVTQIKLITVTGVTPGPGTSGPPANVAALTAIALQIQGLLE